LRARELATQTANLLILCRQFAIAAERFIRLSFEQPNPAMQGLGLYADRACNFGDRLASVYDATTASNLYSRENLRRGFSMDDLSAQPVAVAYQGVHENGAIPYCRAHNRTENNHSDSF